MNAIVWPKKSMSFVFLLAKPKGVKENPSDPNSPIFKIAYKIYTFHFFEMSSHGQRRVDSDLMLWQKLGAYGIFIIMKNKSFCRYLFFSLETRLFQDVAAAAAVAAVTSRLGHKESEPSTVDSAFNELGYNEIFWIFEHSFL